MSGQRITSAVRRSLMRTVARGAQATHAGRCAMILPVLAQAQKTAAEAPASGEGGAWPVIDWLLVAVLVCGALFMVCRSSRRN
jgi:hypothetical protein